LLLPTAFSRADSDERVELFTHHVFQHHANGATGQFTQMLPKLVKLRACSASRNSSSIHLFPKLDMGQVF
jgi:hypothetical protein